VQDADYEASGANLVDTTAAFQSDIVLKVRPPSIADEVPLFKPGGRLVSYIQPALNQDLVEELQKKQMTAIGVLLIMYTFVIIIAYAMSLFYYRNYMYNGSFLET
jgi:alanine dehydrogenase